MAKQLDVARRRWLRAGRSVEAGKAIIAARPILVEGLRRCRGASETRLASRPGGGGVCRSDCDRDELAARLWCHDGNRGRPIATVRDAARMRAALLLVALGGWGRVFGKRQRGDS